MEEKENRKINWSWINAHYNNYRFSWYAEKIAEKYHYFLTSLYCIRYTKIEEFKKSVKDICKYSEEHKIPTAFLTIAEPGDALIKKVYNVKEDVKLFNTILNESITERTQIVNPYSGYNTNEYTLAEDGHHLTNEGNQLVFKAVKTWLDNYNIPFVPIS